MNNVYIRNKKSIKTIELTHILFLLPLIIYGMYKNGLYLYTHKYIDTYSLFKPLIILISGVFIGAIVNIIYEKLVKKNKDNLIEVIFSSFHVEYGVLLASVVGVNTNLPIFILTTFVILFLSKFLNNRINAVALTFIIFYLISKTLGIYEIKNAYENSKIFQLSFMDYMIGRSPGGISSTHILLIAVGFIGLSLTNNIKTNITLSSLTTYVLLCIILCIFKKTNLMDMIFAYNYIFAFAFIATDTVSSCYTNKGIILYGILIGLITFGFTFVSIPLAPFAAIFIVSILNNLIDRKANILNII